MRHKIKSLIALCAVGTFLSSFVPVTPAQNKRESAAARTSSPPTAVSIPRKSDVPGPLALAALQMKLAASDGAAQDFFGGSVAVSGDTAVVGAANDDSPGADAGSAYVFVRTGSTWTQQQKLVASDASVNDRFGNSVAISGDTIVVGAKEDDSPNTDAGSAYVFVRTGSVWTQQQKLVAPDQSPFDNFGVSVAIGGDTIIVGADLSNSPLSNTGAAYVFTRTGSTWTQQQKLVASDAAAERRFGVSTAFSGNTSVIGASTGGAYVFVRTNTTWTEQQKLTSSDAGTTVFGAAVGISGDTAVAGCASPRGGGLCIFNRSGTTWSQQQMFLDPRFSEEEPDFFGSSIAIDGNTIVVGAPATDGENSFTQEDIGAAYIYVRNGSTWQEHQTLVAPDASPGDNFGFSVAVSGSTILIGSISDDNPEVNSGSAYVYNNFQPTPILPGQLIISEFRLRGPNGDNDEFVEIYNNTDSFIVVDPADGSSGFALAASDGQTRFVIPTGTVIQARSHLLAVNGGGYSLGAYATGNINFFPGISVNAGIALFNTADPSNFTLANRLDAAGSSAETNALFREGGGYAPVNVVDTQYSLLRDLSSGRPADTQDNQADFRVVSSTFNVRADATYGYPGPENSSSPVERNGQFAVTLLDPTQSASAVPNRVRDFSNSTPCSSFGTLSIRRTLTNNTGTTVTRLRFRVIVITTAPAPSDAADLRPISSADATVTVNGTPRTVSGTTLETAGGALPNNCGGLNSSLSVSLTASPSAKEKPGKVAPRRGSQDRGGIVPVMHDANAEWNEINLDSPLAAGATINVQFLLGVQQPGLYRFFVNVEALP